MVLYTHKNKTEQNFFQKNMNLHLRNNFKSSMKKYTKDCNIIGADTKSKRK